MNADTPDRDTDAAGTAEERPVLRVVSGEPTAEELAALVAVLTSRPAAEPEPSRRAPDWRDPAALHRRPLAPGPGAWRSSALPHRT